ncbi:MAG: ATP-binding protein [Crinalium sp.]
MLNIKRSQVQCYGIAVFTVAIALSFKLMLKPWVALEDSPFLVFFVPVIISAWYGGIGSALLATALGGVIGYLWIAPSHVLLSNSVGDNLRLIIFLLEALSISYFITALQLAQRRSELNKVEAQQHLESLRHSEEGFRLLIDCIKDYAIYRLDPQGYIVSWNEGAERINGYQIGEIIGQHFSRFYTEEELNSGKGEQVLKLAAETDRFEDEGWRVRKDGSRFWANVVITALRDRAGNLKGFAKVTRDVTESKRLETERNQLLAREQASRALAETASEMVQRLQAITDVAIAPLSIEDLLRELLNRISEILRADTAAILMMDYQHNCLVVKAAKGLEEADGEVSIPIGKGFAGRIALEHQPLIIQQDAYTQVYNPILSQQRVQSLLGVPLLLDNRLIGVIRVGTLLPRQFNQDDVQLLQLVAERAALAIDRARLNEAERQALAQAQEANRLKDEFLAIVSHELRTPMQSILGWSQMLRKRELKPDTVNKALETLERNAKQQARVIDDILDVSRILRKKISIRLIQLNIAPIIESAIISISPAATAKNIQITSRINSSISQILGDPDRLPQIINNLLSNAMKFTPNGGSIEIKLEEMESNILLTVIDTGQGIEAEFLPYIFEGFRQADSSRTRTHGGLGLGLTIVRYLVDLHSGTVEAISEGEGKGAKFIVKFPIHQPELSNAEKEISGEIDSLAITSKSSQKKARPKYI